MARVAINTGATANDGTGDTLRAAGGIINNNFLEVYTYLGAGSTTTLSAPVWSTTNAGINTLRNVGIGTTNPTSALTVSGNGSFTGVVTATTFIGNLTGTASTASFATTSFGLSGSPSISVTGVNASGVVTASSFVGNVTGTATGLSGTPNITVGIITATNVVIGGGTTQLVVTGNARVTGILTIGTSSITLNGATDIINVGTGITINGSTGIINATSIVVGGTTLTGAAVTRIEAGSGISVDQNTGQITITATGGTGAGTTWSVTSVGIHTTKNVGIGTTNPTSALTVSGNGSFTGVVTATTFIGNLTGTASTASFATTSFGLSGSPSISVTGVNASGVSTLGIITAGNIYSTGVITATTFVGNFSGSITDATNLTGGYANASSLNVSGIATISQGRIQVDADSNLRFGNLAAGSGSSRNIAIGDQVLYSLNGGQGRNIGVGELSYYETTSGQYNIGLGIQAGQKITTGSYNVIIGGYNGQTELDIRTSSNNVVIADGQGNIRQYINSNGNVGIKTTIITEALTVSGVVSATSFYGALNAGQLTGSLPAIDGSALINVVGSGNGVVIRDDGSAVGTAGTIDFGTNLSVTFSSGIATVSGASSVSFATTAYSLAGSPNISVGVVTASSFNGPLTGTASFATVAGIATYTSEWILGANGSSDYTFTGPGFTGAENDPTLYLIRGQQYKFTNTMNAHAFRIQSTPNGSVYGTQYNDGITNNVVSNGTLTWNVQFDSPSLLYYQCTAHASMGGKIYIIDAGIGTDISINTTGIITASSFSGSGSGLTNLPAGQLTGNLPAIDGSALLNVTAAGTGIAIRDDNSNIGSATTINFGTGLDVTFNSGIATITASGGSLQSRTIVSGVTTSIANNGIGNTNITGFKSYALMKVGLSTAGWLRLYTDSTSRANDASRSQGIDPTPGSGVIAEVVTTGVSTTQIISPFVTGGNLDSTPSTTIYAAITNLSGSTQAITANLTILQLEA